MRSGSSKTDAKLIERLEHIKKLLDETIDLVRVGGLEAVPARKRARHSKAKESRNEIDFSKPMRPFVKHYGVGMSGAKKFTLVLAYLARGDLIKRVSLEEIQRNWNRMTAKGLLGMKFNRFYTATAKDNDWVATEKSGLYHLRPSWKDIFNEEH